MTTREPLVVAPVTVWGLRRGAELAGVGELALHDGGLVLDVGAHRPGAPGARAEIAFADLEGVKYAAAEVGSVGLLTLFLHDGDMYEVSGAARLAGVARNIALRTCVLPEATLRLHALGSHRGRPGSDHDRFFAPLLRARRRAELASSPEQQLASFDAAELETAYRRVFAELAAERFPREAPDRRALEAELSDLAEGLLDSLAALAAAAQVARAAPEDTRFTRWREWAAAVGSTFEQADRCWIAALPPLTDSRGREGRFWRGILRRIGGRTLGALLAGGTVAAGAPASAQHVVVRVPAVPAESLLARGFDVVERRPDGVLVVAGGEDRARLTSLGYAAVPVETPSGRRLARLAQGDLSASAATPVVYRPYDDARRGVRAFLDSLAAANPGRVHVVTMGTSHEGRPIVGVKIGAAGESAARPNVLFMATYHAREWAATETELRLIRCLARQPGAPAGADCPGASPQRIDSLVATRDLWLFPVLNPDGYQYSFLHDSTRLWRKNRRPIATNVFGVDLNRNHSERWGFDNIGSSPAPGSDVYRGASAASEPEVRAVEAFHTQFPPVASVSWHTYSGLVLYPPGYRSGPLPQDLGVYRALAGTDHRPAVTDNLPNSGIPYYHPGPGWHLYPTNGEYTDFASARYGTISFTTELTSGYENGQYYGFEFPDDEVRLQRLFADVLPFALDVIESARDPLAYRSPSTGLRSEQIALESVAPRVRVRVPAGTIPRVSARAASGQGQLQSLSVLPDDSTDLGTYTRRYRSPQVVRLGEVVVGAGARAAYFRVLAATGAEGTANDGEWLATGFQSQRDARAVGGGALWIGTSGASLRSPVVRVPEGADTVSVLFWTQQSTFLLVPGEMGEVRVSRDSGRTFALEGLVVGSAPVFYAEGVTVGGVAGRFVQVEFVPREMTWRLDEIAVVAHAPPGAGATDITDAAIAFSQNPLRVGGTVYVTLPSALVGGDLRVYDFAGRLMWRGRITGDAVGREPETVVVAWTLGAVANGAYVIVARTAAGRTVRRTLFVAR